MPTENSPISAFPTATPVDAGYATGVQNGVNVRFVWSAIVAYLATKFATTAQGAKADNAVQPDAISSFETVTQLNTRDVANRARANHSGTQSIATIAGLGDALNGKSDVGHTHSGVYATAAQGTKADTALQSAALNPTYTALTASRVTAPGDDGADVESTAATAVTLTIAAGTITRGLSVSQYGTGLVTIAAGAGVTIRKEADVQAVTNGVEAVAFLKPTSTPDVFVLTGSLKATV